MLEKKICEVEIAGEKITFETGQVARQADGSVIVRQGDTMVFASACRKKCEDPEIDFLPLRVDYTEKFSAAGKTLGGFIKREGRPTEREILVARLIDRPIRPMFEEGFYDDVQLLTYVWSYDPKFKPDVLAICAASAALTISDIPLVKPLAAVRVGRVDGDFVINPSSEALTKSDLDLVIAGTENAILMIEGHSDYLSEEQMLEALAKGHEAIAQICRALEQFRKEVGQEKDRSTLRPFPKDLYAELNSQFGADLKEALFVEAKQDRADALAKVSEKMENQLEALLEKTQNGRGEYKRALSELKSNLMREVILEEGRRVDGRARDQVRPIWIEESFLPKTHGSALFTRGETQTVATCTLGGESMGQRYETLDEDGIRHFYLQYSFPPFSVGEVGRAGPPGRREVGHGKLAERALLAALPSKESFPYTIRVESNITESNGSSSMASVCGGCLAMMDAGVPIQRPVAGIAMGLILQEDKFAILSDILGTEDALGDMDFKVAGDAQGITSFQMDIKVEGITFDIMKQALMQAKEGRTHILNRMLECLPSSRQELADHAPRIKTLQVKPEKIGTIIGPGGKQIRAIVEEAGGDVSVDIDDNGTVFICGSDSAKVAKAIETIEGLVAEVEIGKVYQGKVTSVVAFGAFVEVLPGKEGLCHVSELEYKRVENPEDVVKEGDVFDVKVLDVDSNGKVRLSRKVLLPKPEGYVEPEPSQRGPRNNSNRSGSNNRSSRPSRPRSQEKSRAPKE